MKSFLFFMILFFSFSAIPALAESEKTLVCFPPVDPLYRDLEFQIKASPKGQCGKDEKIYEVKRSEGGVILFMPYNDSTATSQPATPRTNASPKSGKSIFSNF
jgi:hypothetical protein